MSVPENEPLHDESSNYAVSDVGRMARYWMSAQPVVRAFIRSMVHDFHDAEDICQETAYTVAVRFKDFVEGRSFVKWAVGIARLKIMEHWRKSGRHNNIRSLELIDELADSFDQQPSDVTAMQEALEKCLEKVPTRPRQLLERRYVRDEKPMQIAEHIGASANSVRITLHRIRAALANCVSQEMAKVRYS